MKRIKGKPSFYNHSVFPPIILAFMCSVFVSMIVCTILVSAILGSIWSSIVVGVLLTIPDVSYRLSRNT